MSKIELGFDLDSLAGKTRKVRAKTEYLKEGTVFYRILPSFDASKRINFEYYTHWITSESGGKIQVLCTKGTEGQCSLCDAANHAEELVNRAKEAGASDEKIKELEARKISLKASKNVYLNAVNGNNEVVALQINGTVAKTLFAKMGEAVNSGIDPTSVTNGVIFKFTKTGKGRDSVTVDFKRGAGIDSGLDRTPLSPAVVANLEKMVTNLADPENVYLQVFTAKELGDFTRGIPLKSKFERKNTVNTSLDTQAKSSSVENLEEPATMYRAQPAPVQQTEAPLQAVQATPKTTSNSISNAAAEMARIRALAQGKK